MDVTGLAALITGGKRIGASVAEDLASRGMDVALVFNRSADHAERTAERIRSHGRRAFTIRADLAEAAECTRAVADAAAHLGRLDVLINMASVYRPLPLDQTDADLWDATVNVDLRASFLCAQAAIPHMRRAGGGRIVNVADWVAASGRPRYPGFLPYFVAKRGVIGLTEALALEVAEDGILVNAIAPGPIVAPEGTTPEEVRKVETATPLGRWGGAAEIAKAVAFLLESDFVTGETIRVDGGRHLR
ncbi:MAG: SDR family NAD(P)-dependent oxidoreductase [Vicinamibacterales bacterium]